MNCSKRSGQATLASSSNPIPSYFLSLWARQVVGRAASKAFEPEVPYVVAWIDLEEGPRMISNVIGCPVENVKLGMKVSVLFEQQSPEIYLPKFKPLQL